MLDRYKWRLSVEMFRDDDGVRCAPEQLRIRYAFLVEGKLIWTAQLIKLNKISKISIGIVRHEAKFKDIMRSVLGYSQAFEQDYGVGFVDVSIIDILEDMMSSIPWRPTPERPTYDT